MKYINGLYASFVLMMIVILVSTTILDDEYSGIATFICIGIFVVGNAFYINAIQEQKSKKEK